MVRFAHIRSTSKMFRAIIKIYDLLLGEKNPLMLASHLTTAVKIVNVYEYEFHT